MPNPAHLTARFRCELKPDEVPARFGIVTAFNPHDRLQSAEANAAADNALQSRLKTLDCVHFRVTGGAPDFSHAEPGWGIVADDPEEIVQLGRDHHQTAIYWVDEDVLSLMSCSTDEKLGLGSWRARTEFEGGGRG
jgi:hypothetical protein